MTLSGAFSGEPGVTRGTVVPGDCVPDCITTASADLKAAKTGAGFGGTFNGRSFAAGRGSLGAGGGGALLSWGSGTLPAAFAGGLVTTPFVFATLFNVGGNADGMGLIGFFGAGSHRLSFTINPAGTGFNVQSFSYGFEAASSTPEPASMLLLGTGLAGLAAVRHRRRKQGK